MLLAQMAGQFGRGCGLARALKPGHHNHRGRTRRERQVAGRTPHQLGQLVRDDLDHLLAGVELPDDVGAQCPLLDRCGERLDHLEVDVGLQQCQADLPHGGGDVLFGQRPSPADIGERGLELFGQ